ncbi:YceI family protein [Epibacterium ulvae]|uniref:YceI family protein n=1 Tax=Epibacterium ulvae TaxID=1156985 RepID=UPI001BFC2F3F|nr:YceI family protein [Epibacterium ulvae]MBT8152901.1 YceI family protein [Epibacterium ulvae]
MCAAILLSGSSALLAAPQLYLLERDASEVGFTYYLDGRATMGQMPVSSASLDIDLNHIENSEIEVTLNARQARAGFLFATEAMKSAQVLDVARHGDIRFVARDISGTVHKAQLRGDLTVKGVTQEIVMDAQLFRQRGSAVADLDRLSILLTGELDRHAFGAGGYANLVGPKIKLRILARIRRE